MLIHQRQFASLRWGSILGVQLSSAVAQILLLGHHAAQISYAGYLINPLSEFFVAVEHVELRCLFQFQFQLSTVFVLKRCNELKAFVRIPNQLAVFFETVYQYVCFDQLSEILVQHRIRLFKICQIEFWFQQFVGHQKRIFGQLVIERIFSVGLFGDNQKAKLPDIFLHVS